jgi:hypothetical protein
MDKHAAATAQLACLQGLIVNILERIAKPEEPYLPEAFGFTLSNEAIAEFDREHPPPGREPAPAFIWVAYDVLLFFVDEVYKDKAIERFWFLETVCLPGESQCDAPGAWRVALAACCLGFAFDACPSRTCGCAVWDCALRGRQLRRRADNVSGMRRVQQCISMRHVAAVRSPCDCLHRSAAPAHRDCFLAATPFQSDLRGSVPLQVVRSCYNAGI